MNVAAWEKSMCGQGCSQRLKGDQPKNQSEAALEEAGWMQGVWTIRIFYFQ